MHMRKSPAVINKAPLKEVAEATARPAGLSEAIRITKALNSVKRQIGEVLRSEGHGKTLKLLKDRFDSIVTEFYTLPTDSFTKAEAVEIDALIDLVRANAEDRTENKTIFNPKVLSALTVDSNAKGD